MSISDPSTDAAFVFRPRTGLAACGLWAVLGMVWLVLAARSGWSELLREAPFVAFISVVVYAVFGRPLILVRSRDVLLRNVIRDVSIPYSTIAAIDTQYALTITTTDGRRHQAWAAPASGRLGAARVTEEERKSLSWSGPVAGHSGKRRHCAVTPARLPSQSARRLRCPPPTRQRPVRPVERPMPRGHRWASGVLIALLIAVVGSDLDRALG